MQKVGLVIGYCKTHRNKLVKCVQSDPIIQLHKAPGIISNYSDDIQNSLNEMLTNVPSIHKIYLIIKYERLDIMKSNLKALVPYFKEYRQSVCLIITNFIDSDKKDKNIQILQNQLVIPNEIQEFAIGILGNERYDDILIHNGHQFIGKDIINFFRQSMLSSNSFKLDPKVMGLEIMLDSDILEQLHQIANPEHKNSEYKIKRNQYSNDQDIQREGMNKANAEDQNQSEFGQLQSQVVKQIKIKNQTKKEFDYSPTQVMKEAKEVSQNKQEIDHKDQKPVEDDFEKKEKQNDNENNSWFKKLVQWFMKLFK